MEIFSKEEVAAHNQSGDNWIIIEGLVYDMSKFSKVHPGGKCTVHSRRVGPGGWVGCD